ncbi:MAG: hypothetical protein ABW007_28330 [Chitinophagaceae bacterium]
MDEPFQDLKVPGIEAYQNLGDIISFAKFHFNVPTSSIVRQEIEILEPQLVDLGFTDIVWEMGEEDSFGPLSRLCHTKNPDGKEVTFIYG